MQVYDVAVIGAGAAGSMAAIRAGQLKKNVVLIERNKGIARKVLITGKGRCNITNSAPMDTFIEKFGKGGRFLRTAFFAFSNEDLVNFFESNGLELKTERQGRVFPVTDNAMSVVKVLEKCLFENGVDVIYNARLTAIDLKKDFFELSAENGMAVKSRKVVLAMGGVSYKATGSSGDGFKLADKLGHTVTPPEPGLVPLKTKETWVKDIQGLTLKNIRLTIVSGRKKIVSPIGEMLFTHFGVSGPLILDLSAEILTISKENNGAKLFIDLKTGLTPDAIEKKLLAEIRAAGSKEAKNFLRGYLPASMINIFLMLCGIPDNAKANQITQTQRRAMVATFKGMPLTISGSLSIEEAMVTSGGVSHKDINPRTMESKVVPGLYFSGEIIDGSAASGGYNLQQAFSTGYLAGESAANA